MENSYPIEQQPNQISMHFAYRYSTGNQWNFLLRLYVLEWSEHFSFFRCIELLNRSNLWNKQTKSNQMKLYKMKVVNFECRKHTYLTKSSKLFNTLRLCVTFVSSIRNSFSVLFTKSFTFLHQYFLSVKSTNKWNKHNFQLTFTQKLLWFKYLLTKRKIFWMWIFQFAIWYNTKLWHNQWYFITCCKFNIFFCLLSF